MIDTIIVGSGGAGLSTALRLKELGCDNIAVVSKTFATSSQTSQAQGGINAVLDTTKDSIESHIKDTMDSSHKLANIDNVSYMCKKGKDTIKWLDDLGVPFSRDKDGNIAQRKLGGASNARACYSSDYTGLKILHTLYDSCIKNDIQFFDEYMLLDIIIEDDYAKGIVVLDIKTTQIKQILANKVVLATGGYGGVYFGYNTNSTATTADGIATAISSGVKVSNMEFVQFHPTALRDSCILVSESARGDGGYLVTKDGKRFTDELAPRDIVAREIYKKLQEDEDVFLDVRHLGIEKIKELMPQEYSIIKQFTSLELDKDIVPVKPAVHYSMGGIDVDIDGKTNIKNLFAIGECANNKVHGANRLGGNSLLEVITFGLRVGEIVSKSKNNNIEDKIYPNVDFYEKEIENLFSKDIKENFYIYRDKLGKILFDNVGLFRSQESLQKAMDEVKAIEEKLPLMGISDKSRIYNTNLKEFLEFKNSIVVAKTIINGAISRKESRGSHYRVDFKNEDKEYEYNSMQ